MSCWADIPPKMGKDELESLDPCHRVSKREYPSLSRWMESKKTKQNSFVREWNGTQPTQVSGDGWAANRPVGGLGRTPIPEQKRLKGKTIKTHHVKRAFTVHSGGNMWQNKGNKGKIEKKKEKHERKIGKKQRERTKSVVDTRFCTHDLIKEDD